MIKKLLLCTILVLGSSAAFIGCDTETDPVDIRTEVVADIGDKVILPIYHDLDDKGQALLTAVKALAADTSQANLLAARQAWIASRTPFEVAEAFEFGPIKQPAPGIKPDVDEWPVLTIEPNGIMDILASSSTFTKEMVAAYPTNVRGYHAIEFILWGDRDFKPGPILTPNAMSFLVATTEVMAEKLTELHEAWEPTGGNFIRELKEFGIANGRTYEDVKAALLQINARVWRIAEELYLEYMADPIDNVTTGKGPRTAESYFSDNSHADYLDIMIGVKAVYYGDWNGVDGKGLTDFYKEKDPAFDALVRQQIDEATTAISALGPSFNDAVKNNDTEQRVTNAIQKARVLYQSLFNRGVQLINES